MIILATNHKVTTITLFHAQNVLPFVVDLLKSLYITGAIIITNDIPHNLKEPKRSGFPEELKLFKYPPTCTNQIKIKRIEINILLFTLHLRKLKFITFILYSFIIKIKLAILLQMDQIKVGKIQT